MQGVQAFEPKAKASVDLESFVAEDHFLRRINRVLDLSFIRELTAPRYAAEKGRPSIDPEVFFRMQLVAYFYGIAKDRRLCEEVRYNLAYRWFCRLSLDDDVPDHSSLVAACLRFMHRAAHRQSANSTPPNSTHQMTAESILFQHAPTIDRTVQILSLDYLSK